MHEVAFKLSANYIEWNGFSELLFLFQGRLEKQELSKQKKALLIKNSLDILFVP